MNGKIKLNKIPPNDLLPYNYVSGLPSELQTILSPTTRDLMKKSEDLRHKHVCGEGKLLVLGNSTESETQIYDDVEQNENGERKVNEFGGSFEDYNVVIEKFISRAIHHGHERYHHETLILDASLTHVPVYSHLKIQPTTSICTNYDLIAKQKLVRLESLEELNDMNYVSQL